MEKPTKNTLWILVAFTVLALIGAGALLISVRLGPGVGGDATIYMTSASNLIKGVGLGIVDASGEFRLLPYFPPFFPLVLAFFAWLGIAPLQTALWLNTLLFSLTIWLSGWLVFRAGAGGWLSVTAAALVSASPVLIPVYSWAMAEPLAIFLGLAGLGVTWKFLKNPQSQKALLAGGFICGLSILTRYSMAAFLGAGAASVLLLLSVRLRTRLARAGAYLFVGILPAAVWMAYDLGQTAAFSSRSVESSMGMLTRLKSLWAPLGHVFLFWLLPDSWISTPPYPAVLNTLLLVGMVLAPVVLLGWVLRTILKGRGALQEPDLALGILLVLAMVAYLLVIGLVYITTYPPITIGTRMFSPLHIAAILLAVLLTGYLGRISRRFPLRVFLMASLVLLAGWWGWRSTRIVSQNAQQGMGFNAVSWQQSATLQALKNIPANTPVVTNEEMALYYLTGHSAYPIGEIYVTQPLEKFERYGDEIAPGDTAQQVFRTGGAWLVLFDSIALQLEPLYGERTPDRILSLTQGLDVIFKGEDGGIYRYPKP
ncbi:MAG: hypothetical protein IT308_12575 [Anaerolineaceae bacterium]|nr:hypothetical protein [Anaerolineaceae bacterium]